MDTGQGHWNVEFSGTTLDQPGVNRFWNEHWLPMKDQEGQIIGVNVVAEEITEQIRVMDELRAAHNSLEDRVAKRTAQLSQANEELKSEVAKRKQFESDLRHASGKILEESRRRAHLSAKLVDTLERDRRDVAMYLHDQIGQMLAALKFDLQSVGTLEKAENVFSESIRKAEKKVDGLIQNVKDISRSLRPDMLDTLGLVPALRSLIEELQKYSGFKIQFNCREHLFEKIEGSISLTLYRTAQEALNNIFKHAKATEVFINLTLKNDFVLLTVEDDGVGFDVGKALNYANVQAPLGIMIMQERVLLAGGELTLESAVGKGAMLSVKIPI